MKQKKSEELGLFLFLSFFLDKLLIIHYSYNMKKTIYTLAQIKKLLFPIFAEYHIKKAILFGSYAKNCAVPNSDVDILVDSGLRGLAFFGLLESVAEALDKNVDLLDVSQVIPNSQVDKEIQNTGIMIYG